MDKFLDLLRNLKKNDKVTRNVLLLITDSQKQNKEEIAKTILNYYKDCINKECLRDLLCEICTKDEDYLDFFQRYSKLFEEGRDGLFKLLESSKKTFKNKRIKLEEEEPVKDTPVKENKKDPRKKVNLGILDNNFLSHEFDPSAIYPPKQCKVCGMRYSEDNELYTIHMDDHFRKSRALEEKETISREFFSTYESWIKSVERIVLNLKVDKVEKVIHRGSTVFCSICSSKIETIWDDEEDEFVLKDCVQIGEGKKFCHKSCVT